MILILKADSVEVLNWWNFWIDKCILSLKYHFWCFHHTFKWHSSLAGGFSTSRRMLPPVRGWWQCWCRPVKLLHDLCWARAHRQHGFHHNLNNCELEMNIGIYFKLTVIMVMVMVMMIVIMFWLRFSFSLGLRLGSNIIVNRNKRMRKVIRFWKLKQKMKILKKWFISDYQVCREDQISEVNWELSAPNWQPLEISNLWQSNFCTETLMIVKYF